MLPLTLVLDYRATRRGLSLKSVMHVHMTLLWTIVRRASSGWSSAAALPTWFFAPETIDIIPLA